MKYIVNADDVIRLGSSCYKLFEDVNGKLAENYKINPFESPVSADNLAVLYDFKKDAHLVGCQLLKHGNTENPIEITTNDVLVASFDHNLKITLNAYPKSQGAGFDMYLDPSKLIYYAYHRNIKDDKKED